MTARLAVEKEHVPTVVFIGRLSANKRPEHAIRAFGLVRRQLPDAQMWVIGSGPEEARLRRMAGPGVAFLGRVPEEEKHERLGRAHALVATSVREGWGLVVTEAAASGTVAIGYDVPGLRDSIAASGGILTRADPASLATGMVGLLSSVIAGEGPQAEPAGVVPWPEVAAGILNVARESESQVIRVPAQAGSLASEQMPAGNRWLCRVRVGLGVFGVALLLLSSTSEIRVSTVLVGAAFAALLAATLIGGIEGWSTRGGRNSQVRSAARRAAQGAGTWSSRIGLTMVAVVASAAAQSWFEPGRLIAGGDNSPVVGTAWLHGLFAPWAWSGSDLGGPVAKENGLPWAAVYWLVHALGGSPALAERVWYSALFAGAAAACYLLLRVLRVGPPGSTLGALAYVFNAHAIVVALNPVYLAAMILLAGLPAVVLTTASGRWALRRGILLLGASAPLLGYAYRNPPLTFMIVALLAPMPLLAGWLYGQVAARRALRTFALGLPLLALASTYWLVPNLLRLKIVATSTLSSPWSWTWTEGRATLTNGFWLNNGWGWKHAAYYPYAHLYNEFPLVILKFLLPVVAFSFLALARFRGAGGETTRQARLGMAVSGTALFLVLLSTGTLLPGALVFDPLYRLPLGWLLREPGKFLMLGGLAYAVLLALATEAARERLNAFLQRGEWRWISALRRPGLGLVPIGAAVLAPAFPLMTGAIAPDHRPQLPSVHVSVPAYWTAMASYLNSRAQPGNLLVLPEDDFYQMRYTWGYYGADGFITGLIARNVVDPVAQGYSPASRQLRGAVGLVQRGLLARDWPSVQRTLTAIGTPLLLVRGDVDTGFSRRHITPPTELERALREDRNMRLVRRFGRLELFMIRGRTNPAESATSYVTVNSATPDLRDLALFPSGTALISSQMRSGVPAVLQVPPASQWRLVGNKLETAVSEQPGRRYHIKLLSDTGAFRRQDGSRSNPGRLRGRRAGPRRLSAGRPAKRLAHLIVHVRHRDGRVVKRLSYKLGSSLISGGDFASGAWGPVGNCAAFPGTTAARRAARVLPGQGPAGRPALALSASAGSACEIRSLTWRTGPVFLSLWLRNVTGAAPRMCIWEKPVDRCAALSPLPSSSVPSRWSHYQTIVTPDPGTRKLLLFLYADVYRSGSRTEDEYSDVVVRRSPVLLRPVVLATPRTHERPATALRTVDSGFSPDWIGPPGHQRVEVDGLREGWLGPPTGVATPRFRPSSWYLASRLGSLLAAAVLLALALSLRPRRRQRRYRSRTPGSHPAWPNGRPSPLGHAASHAAGRHRFYGGRDWRRLKLHRSQENCSGI